MGVTASREEILRVINGPNGEAAKRLLGLEEPPAEEEKKSRKTQSEILVELALEGANLFHTADNVCYATIQAGGHQETWPIKSTGFRRWLLRRFYQAEGKPPSNQALQDALGVLEAKAQFDGLQWPVYSRVAAKGGNIYLDLGDETWRAVEITPSGWQVVADPPVKFRRARGLLALPVPVKGGSVDELRDFVNAPDETTWRLLVSWLLMALRPTGPYPVLLLQGEQGSAKSTTARVLRALVDPNTAPLRTVPRDERDLVIAANNSWAVAFDNLSGIPVWLSDALCRLATGGGFSTRELWTNDEEAIFNIRRPLILNGIDEVASRQDLLDRSLVLTLPAIPEEKRREETAFWQAFEAARPRILGALLDAAAAGLRNLETVKLDRLPRMADFAKWVTACEEALPWKAGGFLAAYVGNRDEAIELALDSDPVGAAVKALMAEQETWEGTASELLPVLSSYVLESTRRTKAWPATARTLSNRLRRAATFLRQVGINITFGTRGRGRDKERVIFIARERVGKSSSPSSPASPEPGNPHGYGLFVGTLKSGGDAKEVLGTQVGTQNAEVGTITGTPTSPQKPRRNAAGDDGNAGDARKPILSTPVCDLAAIQEAEALFNRPERRNPFTCPRCGGHDFWQDDRRLLHCSNCQPREG